MQEFVSVYYNRNLRYPKAPFNPTEDYSELKVECVDRENNVYAGVRELFRMLGLDSENMDSEAWNPLGDLVSEGDSVVVKPNFVLDLPEHAITHASVIRPIIDYTLKALSGSGEVVVADAPLQSADFDRIRDVSGLNDLVKYYEDLGVDVSVRDLRRERARVNEDGVIVERLKCGGDPKGYVSVDLKRESYLDEISEYFEKYRVTEYNRDEMIRHHNREKNEYLVAKTVLEADVVINVPKLKTHKKAGITCAMKNMVGMNGDKSWLPHHREGAIENGGDEYPKVNLLKTIESRAIDYFRSKPILWCSVKKAHSTVKRNRGENRGVCQTSYDVREGSWYGNDTIWRMIYDLNTILFYASKDGELQDRPQRKYLAVVDGVLAGQGEGPIRSTPIEACVLVSGVNPLYIDFVCAKIMGFNPEKVKTIKNRVKANGKYALLKGSLKPIVKSNVDDLPRLDFSPAPNWGGHIEE